MDTPSLNDCKTYSLAEIDQMQIPPRRFGSDVKSWPMIDSAPECPALTDDLSRIMYKGRQWAVTKYGIERCDGKHYAIPKGQLRMHRGKSWIEHMAGKYWVDMPDFTAALGVAFLFHRHEGGQQD
ncbi:hypothetical protein [Paracoccus sp. IB05]|uniref:hypothetical protein n=1 Tax=Paracoccus sp. IB05 TaxID=2779367 RepID=UPI0018E7F6A3|nr:hypothetical protein [Paracoccus sp. IB05]MBJ2153986.1 hypothetical protein [Paracoccus sp. IB05]